MANSATSNKRCDYLEEEIDENLKQNINKLDEYSYSTPTAASRQKSRLNKKKNTKYVDFNKIKTKISEWEFTEIGQELWDRYKNKIPTTSYKKFAKEEKADVVTALKGKFGISRAFVAEHSVTFYKYY